VIDGSHTHKVRYLETHRIIDKCFIKYSMSV